MHYELLGTATAVGLAFVFYSSTIRGPHYFMIPKMFGRITADP